MHNDRDLQKLPHFKASLKLFQGPNNSKFEPPDFGPATEPIRHQPNRNFTDTSVMTDDEAFNKYSKELTADFGTSKLVHLDDHLQIAEITIFTNEREACGIAAVLQTNYIHIEHFSDYCFFYHGITFLKVFDLETNRLTDFCRMKPRKPFDLEALKKELKKLRSGIFTD